MPTQFLVGVTRLIAIYFGLRSLEGTAGALMTYSFQKAMMANRDIPMPNIWVIYVPTLLSYLALVTLTWFAAPSICRLAVGNNKSSAPEGSDGTGWNEVMIFLVGTLFVGWALVRFSEALGPLLEIKERHRLDPTTKLSPVDLFGLLMTLCLLGFGIILMSRFASIHRWIRRKSKLGAL
jgi:uncharacterized membrane protein YidH (DUF202 family)